jgi:N-acetylated-alpha-linked acidic dipeptidase
MRRLGTGFALTLFLTGGALAQTVPSPVPLLGFAPASRAAESQAETRAIAVPTPENARRWLKTLTQEPHVAGTPADYRTATFVRDRLQEWGWKVEIVPFEVLLNYPSGKPLLQLLRPRSEGLSVDEAPIRGDKDSASTAAFGAFHGYGMGGTARGQVVYVNYGRDEDFEALEKQGIPVKGKVVLARYGGNFRGLKVRAAQRRGAAGILIYSDPADDGYAKGDVYPAGPYRPGSAIQRGSVQFLSMGPGDPSTPHGPSTKEAQRLPREYFTRFPDKLENPGLDFDSLTRRISQLDQGNGLNRDDYFATIPSLPISYDQASVILKELAGPNVPAGWQGGLPMAYHIGPGPAELQFSVDMDYQFRTIWNVIATLPGSVEANRWVMVGNHRDAWVYGAVDPGSGTAATLEMCRALGAAVKSGWKPRRTIAYASWDAEEYGLVGSTEWAELNAIEMDRRLAMLLNVDSAVSGKDLDFGGVPSLRDLALESAAAITDVRSGKNLRDIWLNAKRSAWAAASPLNLVDPLWSETPGGSTSKLPALRGFVPQMHALGSGSDYTAFLDHLGVPALDIGFSGRYGVYHSIYDSFTWMEKHGDPEFLTHTQAARLYTILIMRAAAAEALPFRFTPYGEALRDYLDELRLIHARQGRGKLGPGSVPGSQSLESAERFEGLDSLVQGIRDFQASAGRLDRALDELATRDGVAGEQLEAINEKLTRVERAFLLPGGLAGRPWFRHAIYAPGVTTGYGAWPLPAIRQAMEEHRPDLLGSRVHEMVEVLGKATGELDRAREAAAKGQQ